MTADAAETNGGTSARPPLTPAEIARRFAAFEARREYWDDGYTREGPESGAPERPFPEREPFSGLLEVGMDESGNVREIADHDESYGLPGDHADLEDESVKRESTYVRACRNRAGKLTSTHAKRKGMAHEAKLESDTAALLESFSHAGLPMEYKNCDRQMYIVSLMTGEHKKLRSTRQCCLLPSVARRKRATIIRDLELWLKRPENSYDQFMLFTGGVRVPVGEEGRRAVQSMGRALSKLNSKPFMKRRGCFFVLRSIEIGKMADEFGNVICNEAGVALAHVHAHVLMHQPGWFSPGEQAALTRDITRCWNKLMVSAASKNPYWGWSGSLENIRECVKYVCKTDALLALDAANLRRTHEMLFRLHRVEPLGVFKRERAARCVRILKVGSRFVAEKGAREKRGPWVHKDWNCTKRTRLKTEEQRQAEKARLEAKKRRKERIAEMLADARWKAFLEGRDLLKERHYTLGEFSAALAVLGLSLHPQLVRARCALPAGAPLHIKTNPYIPGRRYIPESELWRLIERPSHE
ncbi:MAG: hypothetical protein LBI02_00935 [Opitutaceae bacterium]|nr:hypothetical protein [Opitutaceae bacterium]